VAPLRGRTHSDSRFVIPVYDVSRRFDIVRAYIAACGRRARARLRVELLTCVRLPGSKAKRAKTCDPDSAPRKVETFWLPTIASDALNSITVPDFFMHAVVAARALCPTAENCPG